MRQKKDVVCGLLFLLHDSADLGWMNPNRNPIQVLLGQYILSYGSKCPNVWHSISYVANFILPAEILNTELLCFHYSLKKHDLQYENSFRMEATDQPVCNSVLLMWYLVTEDQLRCFGRHNQNQKFTFKSSRPALKIWNILRHIGFKLMRLYSFEFLIVICVNVWLVYGQKAETVRIYHGNSMDITSGSKMLFSSWIWDGACNRTLHDSSLYESRAYAPKKRCGLWLTFFATWLRRSWMNEP